MFLNRKDLITIATGGYSGIFNKEFDVFDCMLQDLVLYGIKLLYLKFKSNKISNINDHMFGVL